MDDAGSAPEPEQAGVAAVTVERQACVPLRAVRPVTGVVRMSGKAPPSPEMSISGLTESGLSGKIISPKIDFSPALPDVRPAPQAGCFVSRLSASKDSAQITLRHRAFRTVAVAPSSGATKPPEQRRGPRQERGSMPLWRYGIGKTFLSSALARTPCPCSKKYQAIRCFPRASKTRLMPSIMSSWTSASSSRAICFSCLWASFDK
jgi:hypothetical protein